MLRIKKKKKPTMQGVRSLFNATMDGLKIEKNK